VHDGGHQPYARGQERPQGSTLQSMLSGESSMGNPQDVKRAAQRQSPGSESKRAPIQSQVLARFIARFAPPSE
jgi:hypothetical protein